jgi:hypothetical protein
VELTLYVSFTEVSPLTTACRNTVVVALGAEPPEVTVAICV